MKPRSKLKFGDDVKIAWIDSFVTYGWQRTENIGEIDIIESSGKVVVNRSDCLTISTSYSKNSDKVMDPLSIPWVSIRKLTRSK